MTEPTPEDLGQQLQNDITNRANMLVEQWCQAGDVEPNEEDRFKLTVGVQAGIGAALQLLSERGWLRVTR